jgi:hypothetical protein
VEELELVGNLHPSVESVLVDEDAKRALGLRLDGVAPPRPLDLPERVRREVADEDLVRRVSKCVVEGAKRGLDVVRRMFAGRLRAVADEVWGVREDEAAAVNGGRHSTSQTVFGSTSVSSMSRARSTIRRRSSSSSPNGCVIAGPRTMRLAPIIVATVGKDVT